jgi:hypothetical protein
LFLTLIVWSAQAATLSVDTYRPLPSGPDPCVRQVGIQFRTDEDMKFARSALKTLPGVAHIDGYTSEDLARWVHTGVASPAVAPDRRPPPHPDVVEPTAPAPSVWILAPGGADTVAQQLREHRELWDRSPEMDALVVVATPCG